MPTYDYQCPKGHRFELFQRISDEPVAECPECGAEARRLISGGAGFLFKGEGFYITDYRSEDYKKKASAEPGAATATTGSSDSGSGGADVGSKAKPKGAAGGSEAKSSGSAGGSTEGGSSTSKSSSTDG